jgi:multidrug efflux system membrane fusion protein
MIIAVVVLLLVGLGTWWLVRTRQAAAAAKAGGAGRAGQMEVPVVAGVVKAQDVAVYLDGLGTVQAFNTVTVRPRVEGLLQKVTFTEGQDVRAGDVLAEIDPIPFKIEVEQAEAKKAEDESKLANAKVELARDEELFNRKILSQKDLEDQKAMVDQLAAAVKADQAAVDTAKVQLDYTKIVSPIDGRTGIRQMDQGNLVHSGDSNGVVVVTQLRPISVVFTLPEQAIGQIHREMGTNELPVLAMERDNSTVAATGKLMVVDNQIDSTTGTIRLKARFENADLHLWPGQFVNTRLHITTRKAAVVVPTTVVQRGPDGAFAFVINDDQTVATRPLKTGLVQDGLTIIESGLKPGEQVVVDGQYKLQNGSKVRTAPGRDGSAGAGAGGRKDGNGKSSGDRKSGATNSDASHR